MPKKKTTRISTPAPTPGQSPKPFIVYGPPAAVVAWIPYYRDIADLPANAYSRHKLSWPALDRLFDSGNKPAPLGFNGQADLEELVNSQDFRAVLSLRDVELYCDQNGKVQTVFYRPFGEVGYTPMRAQGGDRKVTLWYSRGVGRTGHGYECRDTYAKISCRVDFKIGGLGNFFSLIMTGHWAPYAWAKIDYTICCSGSVTVEFSGSYMPTQSDYVDWKRFGIHDMLANTSEQIDGFLEGGNCKAAPGTPKRTWKGEGVRWE